MMYFQPEGTSLSIAIRSNLPRSDCWKRLLPKAPRLRRACLGELIQIDGCEHHWFEDRGPGSWLRTIRPGLPSSEPVVAATPRQRLAQFPLDTSKPNIFKKSILVRQTG